MSSLFSLIIPTFNSIGTLFACLESIIKQSYTNIEVIVVDGNSSDGTIGTILEFSKKHNFIKWISENDNGIYDAMNKGVDLATGEWVIFLGSDDCLHDETVLEDVASYLAKTASDVVYGDAILLSNNQRYGGEFDVFRLHVVNNLCHQTVFYRRSVFDTVGKSNLAYHIYADWDFNIRCFRHTEIKTQYLERNIVVFNNITGVSSLPHEDSFLKQIPVSYIQEIEYLKRINEDLLSSKWLKFGKTISHGIKKIGMGSLFERGKY